MRIVLPFIVSFCVASVCRSEEITLTPRLHHLRQGEPREWTSFPEKAEGDRLELPFEMQDASAAWTIQFRQQDIKQNWNVRINGKDIARLPIDENDMRLAFDVPPEILLKGENRLTIESSSKRGSDDIRVGEIQLLPRNREEVLSEATLKVVVNDATGKPTATPARITIVDENGTLVETGAASNDHLAVRPGTVYTSTGSAELPLPSGHFTVYAGRGFEYSLDTKSVELKPRDRKVVHLSIRREVSTEGYVACDTHVHTRTHSGHGDSTVDERMITLAGEGIELPIATDHNVHVDHRPFAVRRDVQRYFTPVIGNEVTTKTGHFNIFPVVAGSPSPDHRSSDWNETFARIDQVPGSRVVILNHARDIHSGVRPFGPKLFNEAAGVNVEGWQLRANAMEVVNSSATQTDMMLLFRDWMTLLNRGHQITPIGSSDSHDVLRHFVGQGRTYIRCDDSNPGEIDVDQAVDNLLSGKVRVSYGLLTELTVNSKYTSGDVARIPGDTIDVRVRVLAPHWIDASRVLLYSNGELIREAQITAQRETESISGIKGAWTWKLPRPRHDVHLVAIALGPGIEGPFWKTAKAYQPTSPEWTPHVLGCSGAVWVDADGDGRPTAAFDYAQRVASRRSNVRAVLNDLGKFDTAVSIQAAEVLQSEGNSLTSSDARKLIQNSQPHVRTGFDRYIKAWRENQIARTGE